MKKLIQVFLLFFIMANSFVFAGIIIQIDKGVDRPFPIAVIPFNKINTVSGQIQKDLANSGRFSVLDDNKLPARPTQTRDVSWDQWRHTGVEYIVIGTIEKNQTKANAYDVSFQLISQIGERSLIGRIFKGIPARDMVALGHYISDLIYQTLTGNTGYFTTKLAYIEVNNPYNVSKAVYKLVIADYDGQNPQVLLSQTKNPLASPTWSKDGKKIAYVSYVKGRMAIYSIDIRTGTRNLLANYPGINSSPNFSPNNNTMVMSLSKGNSSISNLYLMNLKNRQLIRQLTYSGTNTAASFSADGQELAFTSNRGGLPQIYIMGVNENRAKRVTYSGVQNFDPKFTPDGKYLIFMHQQTRGGYIQIAKLNIDTDSLTVLTKGSLDKSPSVSPDGKMIVYTKMLNDGKAGLAMVSLDGAISIDLPSSSGWVKSPAWSPFLN